MSENKPWLKYYGTVPITIDYPNITIYEHLRDSAIKYPNSLAWDFLGKTCNYKEFLKQIDQFAAALVALGFQKGDIITIAMPNSPQGIIPIYAVNKLGGICSLIHPLCPSPQIKTFLNLSKSKWALTLDVFYSKFAAILNETTVQTLILSKISDYLNFFTNIGFYITKGRKIPKVPPDERVIWYKKIMTGSYPEVKAVQIDSSSLAIILYSGGTTGVPKGIMLSNKNFIALGMQITNWGNFDHTQSILAILPIFHGFGLAVCINAAFLVGGKSILVPLFTSETVVKLIRKKRPNFIVGVPTLFEALSKSEKFRKTNLSCLIATFSGADPLPRILKEKFDKIVKEGGGTSQLREGYGLTEAVTAVMAMPLTEYRANSIGIPFPDNLAKICEINSIKELSVGSEGEICVTGPTVMQGYLDDPEESQKVLRKHEDGRIWLHTGDLGTMDKDGFFYFKTRLKRLIKVSGINVYPNQVEDILLQHEVIEAVSVIGVHDTYQMNKIKAFVVLKEHYQANEEIKADILAFCRERLLKWEVPREIVFRDKLPTTLVGKIAYTVLEAEQLSNV